MNNETKSSTNSISKIHFSRLHEKIQSKYDEMQRKLEKSKSIDMLTNCSDDYVYKEKRKYLSVYDLRKVDDDNSTSESEKSVSLLQQTSIVEDSRLCDAVFENVDSIEAIVTEAEPVLNGTNKSESDDYFENTENAFLSNSIFRTSLESQSERAKDSDESLEPSTPTSKSPKSIRDKIGSRLLEVRNRSKEKRKLAKKREPKEKVNKFVLSNAITRDVVKNYKRVKLATVTVALIEATYLDDVSEEKSSILCCRLRLGSEKRKSKAVKSNTAVVKWQEIMNFSVHEFEHNLEITLWDRDVFVGRADIDLSKKEKEKTHRLKINIVGDTNIKLFILLTLTGISLENTVYEADERKEAEIKKEMETKYAWYQLWNDFSDVGWLYVVVYGAKGLSGNDCFCVLNLANERIQTPTDYKTNAPNWMKIFKFSLKDVTSILEVTVHDERKNEEVGKVSIPLLRMETGKKWYALKDYTQRERAKGNNPRILLEMGVTWNLLKASVRVFNPKEKLYLETEEKLDRHVFTRNLARTKAVSRGILDTFQMIKTCFEWESTEWNIIALIIWLLFCWFFKTWMLPLLLLIPFAWYRPKKYCLIDWEKVNIDIKTNKEDDKETRIEKEEKVSLRQKLVSFQEMIQTVQNVLGKCATMGESIKNLFNYSVPFLSFLAIFVILVIGFIMYLIPVNYIFMCWGIHKFTRKILRPNRIPNNEILDLLSRVPDNETLLDCEEFSVELSDEDEHH